MKRIFLICCIQAVIALSSCNNELSNGKTLRTDSTLNNKLTPTRLESVSIVKLIANPADYNNKLIRLKGFLNIAFEGNAIYLSKNDYDFRIDKNGLWVDFENSKIVQSNFVHINKQYVNLKGIFLMDNKGHNDSYSGAISKITRIDPLGK